MEGQPPVAEAAAHRPLVIRATLGGVNALHDHQQQSASIPSSSSLRVVISRPAGGLPLSAQISNDPAATTGGTTGSTSGGGPKAAVRNTKIDFSFAESPGTSSASASAAASSFSVVAPSRSTTASPLNASSLVCLCGRVFEKIQQKAAHCRCCSVYNEARETGEAPPPRSVLKERTALKRKLTISGDGGAESGGQSSSFSGRLLKKKEVVDYDDIDGGHARPPRSKKRRTSSGGSPKSSHHGGIVVAGGEDWEDEFRPVIATWQAADDLLLLAGLQQHGTLDSLARHVRFSAPFPLTDIAPRWKAGLRGQDAAVAENIASAPLGAVPQVRFTGRENTVLDSVVPPLAAALGLDLTATATQESSLLPLFEDVLRAHRPLFHSTRTPRALFNHWKRRCAQRALLRTSPAQEKDSSAFVPSNSDAPVLPVVTAESRMPEQHADYSARIQWAVDLATTIEEAERVLRDGEINSVPQDLSFLAVLRGRHQSHVMRTKEVLLGRGVDSRDVDVNIPSFLGPAEPDERRAEIARKVSRSQAVIYLKRSGEFFFKNIGRGPSFVDGSPILPGERIRLLDRSLISFAAVPGKGVSMIFEINRAFFTAMQHFVLTGSNPVATAISVEMTHRVATKGLV